MQRNFDRRVEIAFPILDEAHKVNLKGVLEIQLRDNVKGWRIQSDGNAAKISEPDAYSTRSQERLYEMTKNDYSGSTRRPADLFE
jgi:polyphosphate kinase